MSKKISIIIPVYNAAKTIERCLNSVINQSVPFYEIIVVNDGSTDNSIDIINNIIMTNPKSNIILINNENSGVSFSRNYGVSIASGDYISFLDSDDYLSTNTVETLQPYILKNYDFVRFNFNCIGGNAFNNCLFDLTNKEILSIEDCKLNLLSHFLTVKEKIPNLVMLLLINKKVAHKICFDDKLTMMEDVDYYCQLINNSNSCFFLNEHLYNYVVNENSVTHSKKNYEKNIFGIVLTNKTILERLKNSLDSNYISKITGNHLRVICNFLLLNNFSNKNRTILSNLFLDDHFRFMISSSSSANMSLKDRIFILLLKFKNINFICTYINIISFISKI